MASDALNEAQKTHLTELRLNLDPYKLRALVDAKQRSIFSKLMKSQLARVEDSALLLQILIPNST